ncbi:MAG: hypothetical protein QOD69_3530 [Solirubrobacteraceae bacterium]|jgi:hypothetical protein|nr:hypothetical protein [Solirubrobacteraceae bacterium]
MTQGITALAMRPRCLAAVALTSALLVCVVVMALSTSPALAARGNRIAFGLENASSGIGGRFPANWTRDPGPPDVRTKTDSGPIWLTVADNVGGGLCVRLLYAKDGTQLGMVRCWGENPTPNYQLLMADYVPANTRFTVWATKQKYSPKDFFWAGTMVY